MKRLLSCLLAAALTAGLSCLPACAAGGFQDVPAESALAAEVQKAVDYGLMGGYNDTVFGYADPMTRAQFVTVLDRMLVDHGEAETAFGHITGEMEVPYGEATKAYFSSIDTAAQYGWVDKDRPFRPADPITRGEMSELLVRALGLKDAAKAAEAEPCSFTDVMEGKGYIQIAVKVGMTNGTTPTTFSPDARATRAQAAAMLVRVYERLKKDVDHVHGFYAISSHSQLSLGEKMDAVSVGWARMTWDGMAAKLQTDRANGNEYAVPDGWQEVSDTLSESGVSLNLSVFMAGQELKDLLASETGREEAVGEIMEALTAGPYDGVTLDFEGLRSGSRQDFTAFLEELSGTLRLSSVKTYTLYVCVPPVLTDGPYFDGYDYSTIGTLADRVILMAYDYDASNLSDFVGSEYYKTAATAPIGRIAASLYAAVAEIDPSKLLLGFSCKNVAWKIDEREELLSGTPVYPSNETVAKRLAQSDTKRGWSAEYRQSYAIYTTEDGGRYFLWYQNDQSVEAVMDAAKAFGVTGVSLWRLGIVPQYTIGENSWNWSTLLGGAR